MKLLKNEPIPKGAGSRGPKPSADYQPVRDMQIGDCLFFEGMKYSSKIFDNSRRLARRLGFSVVCEKKDDGMRMWRIEKPAAKKVARKQ